MYGSHIICRSTDRWDTLLRDDLKAVGTAQNQQLTSQLAAHHLGSSGAEN